MISLYQKGGKLRGHTDDALRVASGYLLDHVIQQNGKHGQLAFWLDKASPKPDMFLPQAPDSFHVICMPMLKARHCVTVTEGTRLSLAWTPFLAYAGPE